MNMIALVVCYATRQTIVQQCALASRQVATLRIKMQHNMTRLQPNKPSCVSVILNQSDFTVGGANQCKAAEI